MSNSVDETTRTTFLPIRDWLTHYDRSWLRFDVIAALTAWALIVPQGIAYGQLAGLPPQAGLYAAFAGLAAYAVFGTSRHLMVSPTSSTALVSAALVAPLAFGDINRFADFSAMLALLVGGVFILYGLLRLGFVSQFIATSVQVGMMFGLGLTIIATQLPKLMGIPGGEGSFFDQVANILSNLDQTSLPTLALGVAGLAVLLLFKRFRPRFPAALLVVVGSILLVTLLGLAGSPIEVIGHVDTTFPLPTIPRANFSEILTLLGGAVVVSLIGYAESDTVAEQFAEEHHYEVGPNQELVALGAANAAAGLFQGFIVAGGASQTAANESAGAKSQLSGLLTSGLVLLTVVLLMPLFTNLAQAVLGAIVISAVISFLNVPALRHIYHLRRDSFMLAMAALFGVLILGILPGLLLAIGISAALILLNVARPDVDTLGHLEGEETYVNVERVPSAEVIPGLLIALPKAPLLAFNAKHIRHQLLDMVHHLSPPPQVLLLSMEMCATLDVEGVDTLTKLDGELEAEGIDLWLARVHSGTLEILQRSGLLEQIGPDYIYATIDAGVEGFSQLSSTE